MFEWYNLIFELGIVALLLYSFVLSTGVIGGIGHMDGDLHHDVAAGHDAGHGDGHDGDGGDHDMWGLRGFLGIGKVPSSILLVAMFVIWSAVGLISNHYLAGLIKRSDSWAWVSVAIALTASFFGTGAVARVAARYIPTVETYATRPQDLVGSIAEVLYEVSETSGTARVNDRFNNLLDIPVRAAAGTGPYRRGQAVKILSHMSGTDSYIVGPVA